MSRTHLLALLLLSAPSAFAREDRDAPHDAAAAAAPKPLIGPTAAIAVPLVPGKPIGVAIGVQVVVPVQAWRLAAEVFASTPATAFAPALGGDVGVGLANAHGVGGVLAIYARHTFATGEVVPSTQVGPGLILAMKVAPTVLFTVPFVLWVDTASKAVTPTLSIKGVFGAPYGAPKKTP
jgi:hypothetical protein